MYPQKLLAHNWRSLACGSHKPWRIAVLPYLLKKKPASHSVFNDSWKELFPVCKSLSLFSKINTLSLTYIYLLWQHNLIVRNCSWWRFYHSFCEWTSIHSLVCIHLSSYTLLRRTMVRVFSVSSSVKPSLCFPSRLIYVDGRLVTSSSATHCKDSREAIQKINNFKVNADGLYYVDCLWFSSF